MDRRKDVRFPVQFRSSFSSTTLIAGNGTLSDLSIRGCQVASRASVKPGATLKLELYVPESESPIQVAQSVVRWVRENSFGCEFVTLQPHEWTRLQLLIKELHKEPYQKAQEEAAN